MDCTGDACIYGVWRGIVPVRFCALGFAYAGLFDLGWSPGYVCGGSEFVPSEDPFGGSVRRVFLPPSLHQGASWSFWVLPGCGFLEFCWLIGGLLIAGGVGEIGC